MMFIILLYMRVFIYIDGYVYICTFTYPHTFTKLQGNSYIHCAAPNPRKMIWINKLVIRIARRQFLLVKS